MAMKNFISFEDFLCIKYPHVSYSSSIHIEKLSPEQWVSYYNCCKDNWEKFGDQGPAVGSEVITLRAGMSGDKCEKRIITGIYSSDYEAPYLVVSKPKDPERKSLVPNKYWWLYISSIELGPFDNRGNFKSNFKDL